MNDIVEPLKEFGKYRDMLVNKGSISSFNREEMLSIAIFYDWLIDYYTIVKIRKEK